MPSKQPSNPSSGEGDKDALDKILFWHRYHAIADFHIAKDGEIPEITEHQEQAKAKINKLMISREEVREAIGEPINVIDMETASENEKANPGLNRAWGAVQFRSELLKRLGIGDE